VDNQIEANSDAAYVYIFSIIAVAILLIACINFMNLSTARSVKRAREVGIRKTLGSTRSKLIRQFLFESILLTFIAVIISLLLIQFMLPLFNNMTGKILELNILGNLLLVPGILLFAIVVGLLSGLYPALFLSAFQPVKVLRGEVKMKGKGAWLRSSLVIFQFSVSVILFIGTFVVYNQMQYIQEKKLGFEKDQLLIIEKTDDLGDRVRAFMQEIKENPNIINISNSNTIPGRNFGNSVYNIEGSGGTESHLLYQFFADYELENAYKLEMAEGRYFSKEFPTDSNGVIINEKAVRAMGMQLPVVGKSLIDKNNNGESRYLPIIGVVKDFHYQSLHNDILPLVLFLFLFLLFFVEL